MGLAILYADLGQELSTPDSAADALDAVTRTAAARVPGAEWASITRGHPGAFRTVAPTDPRATSVDTVQYELGTGPCVDAILQSTVVRADDLPTDPRWPEFTRRTTPLGVRSMLSFRLFLEDDDNHQAGLNLYSTHPAAFDEASQVIGTLLATHGALAVTAAAARERAAQLRQALTSNREIGVAVGILMTHYKITRDQAFDLLRVASQTSNRRLADIAVEVGDTGNIDLPGVIRAGRPTPRPRPARRRAPPSRARRSPNGSPTTDGQDEQ
jgi:GAF domain-containing protein